MKIKLVCFDLDGTLIDDYTFSRIFTELKRLDEVKIPIGKWVRLEYPLRDFLMDVARLFKGVEYRAVEKAVKKLKLMKGAKELMSFLKSNYVKTAIITGCPEISPKTVAKKLGIDFYATNDWEVKNGVFTGNVNFRMLDNEDKVKIMQMFANKVGCELSEVAAIGDSMADAPMIDKAGIGIAFNVEHEELTKISDYTIKEKDLSKVIEILKENI